MNLRQEAARDATTQVSPVPVRPRIAGLVLRATGARIPRLRVGRIPDVHPAHGSGRRPDVALSRAHRGAIRHHLRDRSLVIS